MWAYNTTSRHAPWLIPGLSPGRVINYRSHRSHVTESPVLTDSQVCQVISFVTVRGVITAAAADVPV